MGIFDVLGKKKREDINSSSFSEAPNAELPPFETGFPSRTEPLTPFPVQREPMQPMRDHQTELVLAKIDLILNKISDIEKRLAEIERIAKE